VKRVLGAVAGADASGSPFEQADTHIMTARIESVWW
jgi:hypothetical protein